MPLIVKGVLCTHTDLLSSDGFFEFTTESVDFALFHLECVEQVLIAPTHLLPIYKVKQEKQHNGLYIEKEVLNSHSCFMNFLVCSLSLCLPARAVFVCSLVLSPLSWRAPCV